MLKKDIQILSANYLQLSLTVLDSITICMLENLKHSDHKHLEDIHLKHLSDAPARLQRLLLKLQPYNLTIKNIPGRNVVVADALSQVNPKGNVKVKGLDVTVHEMSLCIM